MNLLDQLLERIQPDVPAIWTKAVAVLKKLGGKQSSAKIGWGTRVVVSTDKADAIVAAFRKMDLDIYSGFEKEGAAGKIQVWMFGEGGPRGSEGPTIALVESADRAVARLFPNETEANRWIFSHWIQRRR